MLVNIGGRGRPDRGGGRGKRNKIENSRNMYKIQMHSTDTKASNEVN